MRNIDSGDYGTYSSFTVPMPEDEILVQWGSAVGRNVAKITKAFAIATFLQSNSTVSINMSAANFQNYPPPILKGYTYDTINACYTDYHWCGWNNNILPSGGAVLEIKGRWIQVYGGSMQLIYPGLLGASGSYSGTVVLIAWGA